MGWRGRIFSADKLFSILLFTASKEKSFLLSAGACHRFIPSLFLLLLTNFQQFNIETRARDDKRVEKHFLIFFYNLFLKLIERELL